MLATLVYGTIGVLIAATTLWRLRDAIRHPGRPDRWATVFALACSGVGFVAATPPAYTIIGHLSSDPNLGTLIVYGSITACLGAACVWTVYVLARVDDRAPTADERLRGVRGARRILAATVAVLVAMAVLYALAPVHNQAHALDFDDRYARVPLVDAVLVIYWIAYSTALVRIAALCRTAWPTVHCIPWLRRGVRALAIGSCIALGYSIGKAVAVAGAWAGLPTRDLNVFIAPAFASIGAVAMAVGYGISALPNLLDYTEQARALPRLLPLWTALHDVAPAVVLPADRPAPRGIHKFLRVRERTYRRMIEIRDWLAILRPHLSIRAENAAQRHADEAGLQDHERIAAIEAARIAAALDARNRGDAEQVIAPGKWHEPEPSPASELRMLVAISDALDAPSPVVTYTLAELTTASRHREGH